MQRTRNAALFDARRIVQSEGFTWSRGLCNFFFPFALLLELIDPILIVILSPLLLFPSAPYFWQTFLQKSVDNSADNTFVVQPVSLLYCQAYIWLDSGVFRRAIIAWQRLEPSAGQRG